MKTLILVSLMITLKQFTGDGTGAYYGMRWDKSKCEITQSWNEQDTNWKSAPRDVCMVMRKYIGENVSSLDKEMVKTKTISVRPGAPLGLLHVADKLFVADMDTAETCSLDMSECSKPKLNAASALALKLQEAITARLGRLE